MSLPFGVAAFWNALEGFRNALGASAGSGIAQRSNPDAVLEVLAA